MLLNSTESALKERIKELTCLYEVSSIIVNANYEQIDDSLQAIALSLKKAFEFPEKIEITIETQSTSVCTGNLTSHTVSIFSDISIFNEPKGKIIAKYPNSEFKESDFLAEEKILIKNIAIKIGNLLERVEMKKREIALKRKMEHADRLAIVGELTAGIAHELNTPLANILGFAELLQPKLESNKQAKEDLDKIINNAIFSRVVVKKLMFFSCEMPQKMKSINIVPFIKNSIDLLEPNFRKNQIKYISKIEEAELWLQVDTVQLTQILFNLLINAIYFSPKNGLVTIEVTQNNKEIILEITDEGSGLSEEALEKVFQPFYTTKPVGEGSGLGLSVVHGIVMSHKGSITVRNNSAKGATFEVRLPK